MIRGVQSWLITAALLSLALPLHSAGLVFKVRRSPALTNAPLQGRLFATLGRSDRDEPRALLTEADLKAPQTFAVDVSEFKPGDTVSLDSNALGFPLTNSSQIPSGDYFLQGLFDPSTDVRLTDGPGNLFSLPRKVRIEPSGRQVLAIELTHEIAPERLPAETAQVKYVEVESALLGRFHGRPVKLRAGVLLPAGYEKDTSRRYPVWIRIGGYGTRYTAVKRLAAGSAFQKAWLAETTPRFILLQLDGAGPYGDPYYVNSANNGPYGDALVQELLPHIESRFRAVGQPRARVLSGTSTGGWVCLALQLFYPDSFNGAWSSCPDPVDFRAMQLVDIYADTNMYVNRYGNERPSERALNGDIRLSMRRELGLENLLGHGNSFTTSGQQWGSWNAVYSPRGPDGLPVPLWNPQTGTIDPAVAEHWKKYDLRLYLEKNWAGLAPKIRGKLHVFAGEADQYFLNNAVHAWEKSLLGTKPGADIQFVYGPGQAHGWSPLSTVQMLAEMEAAIQK